MRAPYFRHGPGMSAPEAAASLCAAGAASVVADAVAPAGLNAQSREQNEPGISPTGASADKAFLTLRTVLMLKGHVLSRTHGDDGPVRLHVTRRGLVREHREISAVQTFAEQVGATHA